MQKSLRVAFLCAALAAGFLPLPRAKGGDLSNASLSGRYTFRFYGRDFANSPSGVNNEIAAVGVFVADGKGSITGGSLSYNDGGQLCTDLIVAGAYHILDDGEGRLDLNSSPQTAMCPLSGDFEFDIVLGGIDPRSGIADLAQIASNFFTLASGASTSDVPASGVAQRD
jgi:hypothetical protein